MRTAVFAAFVTLAITAFSYPLYAQVELISPFRNVDILVLTAQYAGTEASQVSDTQWVEIFEKHITPYYNDVTGIQTGSGPHNRTTVTFTTGSEFGGPASLQLQTPYDAPQDDDSATDEIDDPRSITREGMEAVHLFDQQNPGQIDLPQHRHLVIVVNRKKRGRALPVMPYVTVNNLPVLLSLSVISEPPNVQGVLDGHLLVAVNNTTVIESGIVETAAHEIGHLVGLPDLYREAGEDDTSGFVGKWCQMAGDRMQNFSAYSRQLIGWSGDSNDNRVRILTAPPPGQTFQHEFRLFPARRSSPGQFEALLLSTLGDQADNVSMTIGGVLRMFGQTVGTGRFFDGFIIEARPGIDRDQLVEQLTPSGGTAMPLSPPFGLPKDYVAGVLISRAHALQYGREAAVHPLDVVRLSDAGETAPISLPQATLGKGATFIDTPTGITVDNVVRNTDNSFTFRLTWATPPLPDLAVRNAWLDNSANGFGTFITGGSATAGDPPPFCGDPLFLRLEMEWRQGLFGIPYPILVERTTVHRLQFRVRNVGTVPISSFKGTIYTLRPAILNFANFNANDPIASVNAQIQSLNPIQTIGFDSTDTAIVTAVRANGNTALPLLAGEEANVTVEVRPPLPFLAGLVVSEVKNNTTTEPIEKQVNNFLIESFIVTMIAPGSPYPRISNSIDLTNVDVRRREIMATFDGLPVNIESDPAKRWKMDINPTLTSLEPAETQPFQISLQPPDPEFYKPKEPRTIDLVGWMNYADSMVRIGRTSMTVIATRRSRLKLKVDIKGASGTLSVREGTQGGWGPAKQKSISISMTDSDGSTVTFEPDALGYSAKTNDAGVFKQDWDPTLQLKAGHSYSCVAKFNGDMDCAAAQSPRANIHLPAGTNKPDLVITAVTRLPPPPPPLPPPPLSGFSITLKNQGASLAGSTKIVAAYNTGPHRLGEVNVPAIDPGASKTVILQVIPVNAKKALVFVVDPDRLVDEDLEVNNRFDGDIR